MFLQRIKYKIYKILFTDYLYLSYILLFNCINDRHLSKTVYVRLTISKHINLSDTI